MRLNYNNDQSRYSIRNVLIINTCNIKLFESLNENDNKLMW